MNYQKPITLPDLPLELLLMISDHSSFADVACLALCNRRLLSSLGSACRNLPKGRTGGPEDGPRIDFLTRFLVIYHSTISATPAYDYIFGEKWLYQVPNSKF
ncbi:hypothetical protein N7519_006099 [Penicillium mononematosum]|uniref:uncharacterized protein n=1 Tax=Penicillium mononematosum TaxID=268346 RepID=UPI00254892ED|nr:uncharacterized protein N7519_006099 [Penicillium mononematosum]KAJ6184798.1 hypothetical protein N7519_006099 [Penicillium mononematosum]